MPAPGSRATCSPRTDSICTGCAQREAAAGLALFEHGEARERARRRTLEQQAAMYAESAGDLDGARAAYERIAISARDELHLKDAMASYLAAQTNLAISEKTADPQRAERRLRDALALAREYGFVDPAILVPMRTYLTSALYSQRKIDEARAIMEPNLIDARAYYGKQDPWLGMILSTAGNLAALDGEPERADALLAESGEIAALSFGPEHPNTRSSQSDRAIVSVLAQDWPEAERRLDAMLKWLDDTGKGESVLAHYLRATRAYVRARREPSAENLAAALELMKERGGWGEGKNRWTADDWTGWLEAASNDGSGASASR